MTSTSGCRANYDKLSSERQGEPSSAVRERLTAARVRQAERYRHTRLLTNTDIGPAEVRLHCQLDGAGQRLMQAAMRQLHLSARAYHSVLKLARTIADLAGVQDIGPAHLAKAGRGGSNNRGAKLPAFDVSNAHRSAVQGPRCGVGMPASVLRHTPVPKIR